MARRAQAGTEMVEVPEDLRSLLQDAVDLLEGGEDDELLDTEHAVQDDCGHGGRTPGKAEWTFVYLPSSGKERWELTLAEEQLRLAAGGHLTELPVRRVARATRTAAPKRAKKGKAVALWGTGPDQGVLLEDGAAGRRLVEGLRARVATDGPLAAYLWSPYDDLLLLGITPDSCMLVAVRANGESATSRGNPDEVEHVQFRAPDGTRLHASYVDCVPLSMGVRAVEAFVEDGRIEPSVPWEEGAATELIRLQGRAAAARKRVETAGMADLADTDLASLIGTPLDDTGPATLGERLVARLVEAGSLALLAGANPRTLGAIVDDTLEAMARGRGRRGIGRVLADAVTEAPGVDELFADDEEVEAALRAVLQAEGK